MGMVAGKGVKTTIDTDSIMNENSCNNQLIQKGPPGFGRSLYITYYPNKGALTEIVVYSPWFGETQ